MARPNFDLRSRNRDVRTWDELSQQERRTGLTVLAAIGAVAVLAVWFLVGDEASVGAEAGAAAPPTVDVQAELAGWYESTATARADVAAAVSDVRAFIQANDGLALEPACVALGTAVEMAAGAAAAPAEAANKAWSDGTAAYGTAARACGNLFDGTAEPVPTLLTRTTTALDTADGLWTALASDLGKPAAAVPAP